MSRAAVGTLPWREASLFILLGVVGVLPLLAQETTLPAAAEVRDQQIRFRQERDAALKSGAAKRFLPALLEKAEELARRGDAALAAGRLLHAGELFRQARWQLPYQPDRFPDHVERILGSMRLRHSQDVEDVAFSPDGRRLASASRDRTVKIWDLDNGHELLTYTGHADEVRAVAFSPDGKLIASAGGEPDVKIWDAATGKDIRTIKGKGTFITSLAFSRDGKHLAVGGDDKSVRLYEAATGTLKRDITDLRNMVLKVAFNHDGSILAAGVGDGLIRLWRYPEVVDNPTRPEAWSQQHFEGATYDIAFSPDNKTLARCGPDGIKLYNNPLSAAIPVKVHRLLIPSPAPANRFQRIVFSKDGKTLFTGGQDGLIRLWDPSSGTALGTFQGHNGKIYALALNAAGNQLASAGSHYTLRLWPIQVEMQSRDFKGREGAVWSASFSPDGRRLVSASADKTVRIWDAGSGKVLHSLPSTKTERSEGAAATVAQFSPNGKLVLSGGGDKLLRLWDAASGKPLAVLKGHEATVTAAAFNPAGTQIVSGSADKRIKIWDSAGKELVSIDTPSLVCAVAFSPDGKQVASGHVDQSIRLWDAASGKEQQGWTAHGIAVTGLAYSPDGQWLASAGADHLIRVWPLATPGTTPITLEGHTGPLSSVAFHRDSQHLLSGGSDAVVKLWKLESTTGKEMQSYRGHTDWVTSVAFSADGHYVVSASVDRTIKIWEITSRDIPLQAEHTGAVQAAAVSPDGKLIASGGTDKSIKLWDRTTGAERLTLQGHTGQILSLAFTPDSKTLVSSSSDGSVRLWNVQTGKELPRRPNFIGLTKPVLYLAIPPDGNKMLAWVPGGAAEAKGGERYTTIKAYDLEKGDELFSFNDTDRNVMAVAFMPDGSKVALGAKDGSVRVYDLEQKPRLLPGGDWFIFKKGVALGDLAFTPDGKRLLVGDKSGDIAVCSIEDRKILATFKGHKQQVAVCMVSPDGKLCASAGLDNMVKLWDIASGKEVRQWDMRGFVQEGDSLVRSIVFTPDSRNIVTANANTTLFVLQLP